MKCLLICLSLLLGIATLCVAEEHEVIHTHHGDIPRFSTHSENVLVVPIGETVTLPETSDYHAIEVAGTLRVSREHGTTCRVVHLTILPGGKLDVGTSSDPVLTSVEFVFPDVPLDSEKDPMQWGNGVINLGTFQTFGRELLQPWGTMGEVDGGTTQLTLMPTLAGWKVGDGLLVPDTQQLRSLGNNPIPIRQEPVATITDINGNTVTLATPLEFNHHGAYSPDGQKRYSPYVANTSRNIVFRSENPNGTRGHIIHLGESKVDSYYTAYLGLGRTSVENIDNSTVDAEGNLVHFGTNVIGRYAFHWHHVRHVGSVDNPGPIFGNIVGCYLDGTNVGKWGIVVHATHDVAVRDNVVNAFVGSGIVTEDGDEVRSVFERNFVMGSVGNGINGKFNFVTPNFKPGAEGAGFWFHGMGQHVIKDNVSVNNHVGYQFLYRNQVLGRAVPVTPGGEYTLTPDPRNTIPAVLLNNVGAANTDNGWETWNNPKMENTEQVIVWHNGKSQMKTGDGEPSSFYCKDFQALVKYESHDRHPVGISSSAAYTPSIELDGGVIEGCRIGVSDARRITLKGVTMQNATNLNYVIRPNGTPLEDVTFKQLFNEPVRNVVALASPPWEPGQPFPARYADWYTDNTGHRFVVKNWQGTGKDYFLFEPHSLRDRHAWHSPDAIRLCPEAGLTMGQCWDKYGIAYGGGVISQEDVVDLPGLEFYLAMEGSEYPLGPTKTVLNSPNMLGPASVLTNGDLRFYITVSGEDQFDQNYIYLKLDDNDPIRIGRGSGSNTRVTNTKLGTEAGTHIAKLWITDEAGEIIPSTQSTFNYYVGEPTDPPVDPDPEPEPEPDPELEQRIADLEARVKALEDVLEAVKAALQ